MSIGQAVLVINRQMVRLNLLSRWPRPSSGRQGKAKVTPTSQYLQHETPLQNVNTEDINKQIKTRQQKQAHYYNREARDLPPLQEGDEHCTLRPFTLNGKTWDKATVAQRLHERSYLVAKEDASYK